MSESSVLLVIDAQVNMFDPANPVEGADALLARLAALVAGARAAGTPVVFVRNCGGPSDPDQRDTPGWALHPSLEPADDEPVLDKTTCNTFASTSLSEVLVARGARRVVIAGLQSEFCVRETALGALARGFDVTLVEDGHSTYPGGGKPAAEISAAVNAELAGRARVVRAGALAFA